MALASERELSYALRKKLFVLKKFRRPVVQGSFLPDNGM